MAPRVSPVVVSWTHVARRFVHTPVLMPANSPTATTARATSPPTAARLSRLRSRGVGVLVEVAMVLPVRPGLYGKGRVLFDPPLSLLALVRSTGLGEGPSSTP